MDLHVQDHDDAEPGSTVTCRGKCPSEVRCPAMNAIRCRRVYGYSLHALHPSFTQHTSILSKLPIC